MDDLMTNTLEKVFSTEQKAALRGAVFADRELVGVDLSGADLRDARFEKTRMVGCDLTGADLRGAQFSLCDLRGVVLADALFGDNRFDGTTIEDAIGLSQPTRTLIEGWGGTFQPICASQR